MPSSEEELRAAREDPPASPCLVEAATSTFFFQSPTSLLPVHYVVYNSSLKSYGFFPRYLLHSREGSRCLRGLLGSNFNLLKEAEYPVYGLLASRWSIYRHSVSL